MEDTLVNIADRPRHVGFSSVKLKNFKGIGEGEISDLGLCNVILGSNNAGKTTILEALYLLSDVQQRPPGFNNSLELLSAIHNVEVKRESHHVEVKRKSHPGKVEYKFLQRFYTSSFVISSNDLELSLNESKLFINGKEAVPGKKNTIDTFFFTHTLIPYYHDFIVKTWEEIGNRVEVIDSVLNILNKISNEKYWNISLEPFQGDLTFYIVREDKKRVRLNDIGEGFKSFIIFDILLQYLNPSMILIDNLESHVNSSLLTYFVQELSRMVDRNSQVFVTTHNLDVAEGLMSICGGKGIVVDIGKDGKLKARIVSQEEIDEYRKIGLDPRSMIYES